ncbi:MAG: T9SS C-terminal target domain-containing protein [Planctomycetota bacterium]|nr:T9SS C-terminal target domain-containing protein [Planctomycetota bacterium]
MTFERLQTCLLIVSACIATILATPADAVTKTLAPIAVSQDTANKPQSKVWSHAGRWWAVLPSTEVSPPGTWLWRLEADRSWTNVLHLSTAADSRADVQLRGRLAHVFLHGASPQLVSIEYSPSQKAYKRWKLRSDNTPLALPDSETASLAIDSRDRIWIATESGTSVHVYYADAPYAAFAGPLRLADGIAPDDIAAITRLPFAAIGVLWSNQKTGRFGFRIHRDSDQPSTWQSDEVPAAQSARNVGLGMADDHLNFAVGRDGTLYVAVKTSFDTAGYTKIALLVRRPNGTWDDLHEVDTTGTRPIVVLNEKRGLLHVIYTSREGLNGIVVKETRTDVICFGPRRTLIHGNWNNTTSTPCPWNDEVVVLVSNGSVVSGVLTDLWPRVTNTL